jgi:hypothetical protein
VFLQIVTFAHDVGVDFLTANQANPGYFTHCGVRLFRSCGVHTCTYSSFLRARIKGWRLGFELQFNPSFSYKLLNGRHLYFLL